MQIIPLHNKPCFIWDSAIAREKKNTNNDIISAEKKAKHRDVRTGGTTLIKSVQRAQEFILWKEQLEIL